jgi:hypothetical protein
MLNGLAIYTLLTPECLSHTERAKAGTENLRSHRRRRRIGRLRCVERHGKAAQQVAVLAKHLHREVPLAEEVSVGHVEPLLLKSALLASHCTLSLKPLEVRLLLILPEVTERLTHLPCGLQASQPLARTKLTRLLTETLRLQCLLLVSKCRLETGLSTQLLRLESGL